MPSKGLRLQDGKKGTTLALRVTPRARKNEIVEVLSDGTVKVHLTSPPVEGKANAALLKFLAEILDIPASHLEIVAGTGGRDKLIFVTDLDTATLHKRILENIR